MILVAGKSDAHPPESWSTGNVGTARDDVRMPSLLHEAPLELLRAEPRLAAVLLEALGVATPPGAAARIVNADVTAALPAEMRTDGVILLEGDRGRLAVITEIQLRWDEDKAFTWPAYLTQVRAAHKCDTVLLVICPDPAEARRCRQTIATGHPGFVFTALVIDAASTPRPDQAPTGPAAAELVVLAVLTGALDLEQDSVRHQVLDCLARVDDSKRKSYTIFVLNAASAAAQRALEELMATTQFSHPFFDRLEAEAQARGKARGEADIILRVLTARGVRVPDEVRERVLSCSDTAQLEAWSDRAATATTVEDVFDH
jgi:hypothetical protein